MNVADEDFQKVREKLRHSLYTKTKKQNEQSGEKMSERKEKCKCGHFITEHLDFIDYLDEKKSRPYREWVAKGLGKCSKCDCKQFRM